MPATGSISDIRATTVTVPLDAPIRHAHGAHWGRFVRAIVEVETDEGLLGVGEMSGGGMFRYANGEIRVPEGPGRPGWYSTAPNTRYATPEGRRE